MSKFSTVNMSELEEVLMGSNPPLTPEVGPWVHPDLNTVTVQCGGIRLEHTMTVCRTLTWL